MRETLKLKAALTVWLLLVGFGVEALASPRTPTLPQKRILIVYGAGDIDASFTMRFAIVLESYFANKGSPDYLLLSVNSTGGLYEETLELGALLDVLKNRGMQIVFFAGTNGTHSVCASGCFLLSAFANWVVVYENTAFGFGHRYKEIEGIFQGVSTIVYLNRRVPIQSFNETMTEVQMVRAKSHSPYYDAVGSVVGYLNALTSYYSLDITKADVNH